MEIEIIKSVTERQVSHDLTHVESEKVDLREVESRIAVTRPGKVEDTEGWGKVGLQVLS